MFEEARLLERPLRWAMIGGGRDSQVGYPHRTAAARDGLFELVAGAFDIDPGRGLAFATSIGVAGERCYPDYQSLLERESERADGIEVVTVATANSTHYDICRAALGAGLHVVCEKPLTLYIEEAEALAE